MEQYKELNRLLEEFAVVNMKKIENCEIAVKGISLMKIRDILIGMGTILKEDTAKKIYVAVLMGGFAHKNKATAVFKLSSNKILISIYAKEGIINQHTCEGIIDEFKEAIKEYRK